VDGRTRAPSDAITARRGGDRTPVRAPAANGGRRVENRVSQPSIDARRARPPEEVRSIIPDSRDRADGRNLPQEIRPSRPDNTPRRAVDRLEPASGSDRSAPQIDARRARPDDGSMSRGSTGGENARPDNRPDPQPQARRNDSSSGEASGVYRPESRAPDPRPSEPRTVDRGSDRGDRGSYSPPPRSAPSDGGGMRGGSGGGDRSGSGGSGSGGGGSGGGGSGGGGGGGGGFRWR
jgi:hypothetical protein